MAQPSPAPPEGLSAAQVEAARARAGPNVMPQEPPPSLGATVLKQLLDPIVVLLLAAGAVSLGVLREWLQGAAILAIVAINTAIGTVQSRRAEAALASLRDLAAPIARVVRGGRLAEVPAADLVPGDVVHVAAGDRVPADLQALEMQAVSVDESVLTGESLPVGKAPGRDTALHAGTLVVRGRAVGRVSATGAATRLGRIAAGVGKGPPAPLQRELSRVARRIGFVALLAGAVLAVVVAVRAAGDRDVVVEGLVAAVALALAVVPEGLLAVVTTALALGVQRMARRGCIVRRLPAVEALGQTQVLCVDKTGTLTEGRLAVAEVEAVPGRQDRLWDAAVRCNDATPEAGDPLEVALLQAAQRHGHRRPPGRRVAERPFDPVTRSMAVVHEAPGGPVLSVKGAPEAVLPLCRPGPEAATLGAEAEALARRGLRVLVLADAPSAALDATLEPVGLVAFEDPVRDSARAAMADCRRAGLAVVMVTGDHASTASHVGGRLGLDPSRTVSGAQLQRMPAGERQAALRQAAIVARVQPETKVDLVRAHRGAGRVVAMMGDGVNDAPALRQADVGVAVLGGAGTDVAREAAAVVLTSGDLGTLVTAVREGRRLHGNIVRAVSYLLAGNASEVIVVLAALAAFPGFTVPLAAVQLLWINLITDGLPALALAADEAPDDPLARPPRPRGEPLLGWRRLGFLAARGALMAALVLATGAAALGLGWDLAAVRTQIFHSLVVMHLVLAFVVRAQSWTFGRHAWGNRFLTLGILGSLALQAALLLVPALREAFLLAPLPVAGWLLAAGASLAFVAATDLMRLARPATRRA